METPIKRGRGRPTGSKTVLTPKQVITKQTMGLYKSIEHMLTPDQRVYFEAAFNGRAEFDSVMESELFLRFFSVYVTKVLSDQVSDPDMKIVKDFSSILGQFNTALKTLEDMKNKRLEMELKNKNGDESGVVGETRESALGRLQGIFEKYPTERTG